MGVIRRLEARIEMHCTGITNTFSMRTANLPTSQMIEWKLQREWIVYYGVNDSYHILPRFVRPAE